MTRLSVADAVSVVREEFDVLDADTPSMIDQSYRLRYQVYCVERGFLSASSGLEIDEFDPHSRHVVLISRNTDRVIGSVRMVLGSHDGTQDSFPMQQACSSGLFNHLPLGSTAEISRFAISKERRYGLSSGLLRLGLVQGLVRLSRQLGITHWCAIMEPTLLRLLRRNSIYFHALGPLVDHHGLRQPCFSALSELLERVANEQPEVWHYLSAMDRIHPTTSLSTSLAA
jgi:N-acyl-L-homoserine lactone synthetase